MATEPLPDELSVRPELWEILEPLYGALNKLSLNAVFNPDRDLVVQLRPDKSFNFTPALVNQAQKAAMKLHQMESEHGADFSVMERKAVEFVDDIYHNQLVSKSKKRESRDFRAFYVQEVAVQLANQILEDWPGIHEALEKVGVEGAFRTGMVQGVYAQHVHGILPSEDAERG